MQEVRTKVMIVGGGTGGAAAALACARMGVPCIVAEPTDWVGGQLTAQGVPPDENRWIETFGGTRLYQDLREGVRRYYRAVRGHLAVTAEDATHLNPGGGWVSRLCAEPRIWHDVLLGMMTSAGFGSDPAADCRVLLNHELVSVETDRDRIRSVALRDRRTGAAATVVAELFLDATETGDVLHLGSVEHALGAEHQRVYGELHGRVDFEPASTACDVLDQQACSWCFAVEHRPGEDHRITKPAAYDSWRAYVPSMSPPWCGPLFSWTVPSHSPPGCRTFRFVPWPDEPNKGEWEMWRYRRIVDRAMYQPHIQASHPDVSLINMVQMDYWRKPLLGVTELEHAAALDGAREQGLCWLYWMQTEAPRHDGRGAGYPGLKLRGDELGTTDGLAKSVYIREPRRLMARTVITEAHVGTEQRKADGWDRRDPNWSRVPDGGAGWGTCEPFSDSVGIGHYMIDLHPSCAGRNNVYVPAAPFRIPLGALIPKRVENLLAAGKCLGVTHITNGAYRMHHVEWNVGESAGTLAAWCLTHGVSPTAVHANADRIRDFQGALAAQGVRIAWPWEE